MYSRNSNTSSLHYFNSHFFSYPCSKNLSILFSAGFILYTLLILQVITGVMLVASFTRDFPFKSVALLINNNKNGSIIRNSHIIGSTLLFVVIFIHIFRSIRFRFFFPSNFFTVVFGIVIWYIFLIAAFTGYILPWGQMSF